MGSKRKPIIVISPALFPGTAGDSANYLEILNAFKRKGLRVVLVCPWARGSNTFDNEQKEKGVKVVRIPFSPPRVIDLMGKGIGLLAILRLLVFYFIELFVITLAIIRNRTRICMIRHAIPTIHLAPILSLMRVRSVADGEILSSSQEWATLFSPSFRRVIQLFEQWHRYTFWKVTGESQLKTLISMGFPHKRIIMTRIGINVSNIPVFEIEKIPPATFGYFGNLAEWQGVDFLLRSFAKALQKKKSTKLYIIGDGPVKNNLQNLAKDLRLHQNVIFCRAVPREVLWYEYFKKFRVMIIPRPVLRGVVHQPIKLAEALAAGKPVIATSVKGLKKMDGKGVYLVQPGDEEELANAIIVLAEDEQLLQELSQQATRSAQEFDIDAQVKRILLALGISNES